MVGFADLGKRAKCLLRGRFQFSSFRVVAPPIASSRAMDARWNDQYRAANATSEFSHPCHQSVTNPVTLMTNHS
jgi:hypothetical protein